MTKFVHDLLEKMDEQSVKALWSLFVTIGDSLLKTSDQLIEIDVWLKRIEESIEVKKEILTEKSLKMLKQIVQIRKNECNSKNSIKSADYYEQKLGEILHKYAGDKKFDLADEIIVIF